jgi:hypothetical protein
MSTRPCEPCIYQAGATGLEPATSGVTGQLDPASAGPREGSIALSIGVCGLSAGTRVYRRERLFRPVVWKRSGKTPATRPAWSASIGCVVGRRAVTRRARRRRR